MINDSDLTCERKTRVEYSPIEVAEMLEARRHSAFRSLIYESGKEAAYADAIALLRESLKDWSNDDD